MYKVEFTGVNQKTKEKNRQEFVLGAYDTPEYNLVMDEISELLYGLELDFDEINGDGDLLIDDLLIAISEEEDFEESFDGKGVRYRLRGRQQ